MTLDQWQERLEAHFKALHFKRVESGGHKRIFALEHGLCQAELEDLKEGVRAELATSGRKWAHRLPWIVYASEIGYRYSGDEYWPLFEDQTPGWRAHGSRHWIRRCFRDFHKDSGGVQPSGRWAEHFTIICWPIRHAILPTDLQRHFAKVLYR